jgi:hypothetical protein
MIKGLAEKVRKTGFFQKAGFPSDLEKKFLAFTMKLRHDWTREPTMKKRTVKGKEIAWDVQVGMGDTVLMEKYNLRAKQLEQILRKLLQGDLITHMQLYERTSLQILKSPALLQRPAKLSTS